MNCFSKSVLEWLIHYNSVIQLDTGQCVKYTAGHRSMCEVYSWTPANV